MSVEQSIKHIVLVGQHLPLMVSAAILSSQLKGHQVRISAVEINAQPESEFECSGSEFMALCELLQLPIKQLLQQCQATFSLGQQYVQDQRQWFVPLGHYGVQTQTSEFIQGIFRLEQLDLALGLESVCIAAQAAKLNKFAIPPTQRRDLQEALSFAAHLPTSAYAGYLKQFAAAHKVDFMHTDNIKVDRDNEGQIQLICLADNTELSADFWIDCSGSAAVLARPDDVIAPLVLWDKKVECFIEHSTHPERPYSSIEASPFGWLKSVPLAGRSYYQLEYNSRMASQAEVEQWLQSVLPATVQQFKHRDLSLGIRHNAWQKNCLWVGNAAVNLGALCFSELHFVQAALEQFLALYPANNNQAVCADWYNKNWQKFVADASEYIEFHAWLVSKKKHETVADISNQAIFKERVNLFLRCGRMLPAETDAVADNYWYSLLNGTGLRPQQVSLYLSNLSDEQLSHSLAQVRLSIDKLVAGMPSYQDFYHQFNRL